MMPCLAQALDPAEAEREFTLSLPRLTGERGIARVRAIRVTRYKPGRRCVIEYDVEVERPDTPPEAAVLIGKVRVGHECVTPYRLLKAIRAAGFGSDSADGISVPKPVGTVPRFGMWLQHKAPGRPATELLTGPLGEALAGRIAEAAHKLHRAGVPTKRRHTMDDELRFLRRYLDAAIQLEPQWAQRIERLMVSCAGLGAATPPPAACGIHRDFYPDQVIVDGARLYLVDFDLYCEGDPGVDAGNFLGHITEQSLRTLGDPQALGPVERALEERFVALSGEAMRAAVRAYAMLTLARHVYLSMTVPGRRAVTESVLDLCEERLAMAERALT